MKRHGKTKTREYRIWVGMKQRCLNPQSKAYKRYGGRGIKVCLRWQTNFLNFLDDMGTSPFGQTLERIDNDGDYCHENCRWATREEQSMNRTYPVGYGKNGGRPKQYKDPKHLNIVVEGTFKKHLQKQAAHMSAIEGKPVNLNETVRRGLLAAYPMPHQEMFKF